jgi:hypothetical protein
MNKIIILLIFSSFFAFSSHTFILGNVDRGSGLDSLPDWKVDAALILISSLSDNINYIDLKSKSDFIDSLEAEAYVNKSISKLFLEENQITHVVVPRINRLNDILGVTIIIDPISDTLRSNSGTGFANLNLRDINTEKSVYDLSLTYALQRAFADAYDDSTMFDDAPEEYKIYPWKTLVIGGLEFKENEKLRNWEIFQEKVVNSFTIVENIFEASYNNAPYIVYDTATRDTLYTKFNMYGIENYDAPTRYEIDALVNFDIDFYITGSLTRIADGAEIKIFLCEVEKNGLKISKTVKDIIEEDSMEKLEEKIRELTKKLLL